jgi:hypothetical protein
MGIPAVDNSGDINFKEWNTDESIRVLDKNPPSDIMNISL